MGGTEMILSGVLTLCSLGCLIYMLIRLAQEKGALHAVLGFLFPIYPFFWGWVNSGRLGIVDVMGFWTAVMLIYTGFTVAMTAAAAQSMMFVP